ncbi:MAG: NAD(P)H-hydrate dehydratase [Candidatus Omnitrophica bacterium]|nr:NAD(P)H-hydrate dehydratase [Candidatus Omnitrophota bacterium]
MLRRKLNAHKGDFGHVFIVAGSLKFSGAALLSAEAALRSGAGLVTLALPKGIAHAVIKVKLKEVMLLPLAETKDGAFSAKGVKEAKVFLKKADVLLLGPGMGQEDTTQVLARNLISAADIPALIDADGLNALVGHLDLLRRTDGGLPATRILTPHTAEMARLTGRDVEFIERKRRDIARAFAATYGITLVLKGHRTIVADWKNSFYLNKTGNPGMATAGSGDVLSGMIAAFLGQGLRPFDAAKYAVYLHGLAGDLAAKEKTQMSLIASDIIAKIPEAIKMCK